MFVFTLIIPITDLYTNHEKTDSIAVDTSASGLNVHQSDVNWNGLYWTHCPPQRTRHPSNTNCTSAFTHSNTCTHCITAINNLFHVSSPLLSSPLLSSSLLSSPLLSSPLLSSTLKDILIRWSPFLQCIQSLTHSHPLSPDLNYYTY